MENERDKEQSLEGLFEKLHTGVTMRYDEKDWVLLRALSLQRDGHLKEAKDLFKELIKYHTEPAEPYGIGLFMYVPNSHGVGYGLAIAKLAGLEKEVIERLEQTLEGELYCEERMRPKGPNTLKHIALKESDHWSINW